MENLFLIDELQAIRADPNRQEHADIQYQVDMLLLYCAFGFANELLKLVWNDVSFKPSGLAFGSRFRRSLLRSCRRRCLQRSSRSVTSGPMMGAGP